MNDPDIIPNFHTFYDLIPLHNDFLPSYLILIYLFTYLLHGAESFLRS